MPTMRPKTLRDRLLHLLWWPLVAILLLSSVYDYRQALNLAQDDQDLALGRVAIALLPQLDREFNAHLPPDHEEARRSELTMMMETFQRAETKDKLSFVVVDQNDRIVAGDPRVWPLREVSKRGGSRIRSSSKHNDAAEFQLPEALFSDKNLAGEVVRVVTFTANTSLKRFTVVIAETTVRREEEATLILTDSIWPNVLLMVVALTLVYLGVDIALRPLDRLSAEIAARGSEDLRPLPIEFLPGEITPLARALNYLMANLRASADSQQVFLSNAAHQLRTPLAGIQTQLELAAQDDEHTRQERIKALTLAIDRISRTTHQMLALARTGERAVNVEDFSTLDLQTILENAATEWLDTALSAQVDLAFEAGSAHVNGSSWMLRELIGNLIDNAIRYSPPGETVLVRCATSEGDECELSVTDSGPGITPLHQARIFERFYRPPGAKAGGAGLGLAIVSEVAERHRGRVLLGTGASGQGLKISVFLPKVPAG